MSIATSRRFVSIAAGVLVLARSALSAGHPAVRQDGLRPGGGGWAPRPYRRAVRALGLTADQQSRIREILKAHADEILAQRQAGIESRKALHAATLVQPFDEAAIRQRAMELGEIRADGAVLFAKIRSEIWPLLTAEQQQKAETFRQTRGGRLARRGEALGKWLRQDG